MEYRYSAAVNHADGDLDCSTKSPPSHILHLRVFVNLHSISICPDKMLYGKANISTQARSFFLEHTHTHTHTFINRFMVGESAARSNHADIIIWLQADVDTDMRVCCSNTEESKWEMRKKLRFGPVSLISTLFKLMRCRPQDEVKRTHGGREEWSCYMRGGLLSNTVHLHDLYWFPQYRHSRLPANFTILRICVIMSSVWIVSVH